MSTSAYPGIKMLDFSEFAVKMQLMDDSVKLAAFDRAFIAATNKQKSEPPNMVRFEFFEILVRIAEMKYV